MLRLFFEPLIEEAQARQARREAHEKIEMGGHLIDRLLSTITGEFFFRESADDQADEERLIS